jgi:hypothetical protein
MGMRDPPTFAPDPNIYDNSPFISKITDTMGRGIEFCTADPGRFTSSANCIISSSNTPTINGRLRWIKYPNYNGTDIYVVYNYAGNNDELLNYVEVRANSATGLNMNLTTYYDYYTDVTSCNTDKGYPCKMLKQITYPTGAYVKYEYTLSDFYTYNYFFPVQLSSPGSADYNPNYIKRWAVSKKTLLPDGSNTADDEKAIWQYTYGAGFKDASPNQQVVLSNTTVILMNSSIILSREIHQYFPSSQMPTAFSTETYNQGACTDAPLTCIWGGGSNCEVNPDDPNELICPESTYNCPNSASRCS